MLNAPRGATTKSRNKSSVAARAGTAAYSIMPQAGENGCQQRLCCNVCEVADESEEGAHTWTLAPVAVSADALYVRPATARETPSGETRKRQRVISNRDNLYAFSYYTLRSHGDRRRA